MPLNEKVKKIWQISWSMAKADFRLRNEDTYLGIIWYLLNPLLIFGLLLFLFAHQLGVTIQNYPAYLLLGIIMFNFFQNTTTEATTVIISNAGLIKAINFPREILVLGIILKNLFSHFFEVFIFLVFFGFSGILRWEIIFYPVILILFGLFTIGFSFFLSSLTIYFADLGNIWLFASRLIWLTTPIFYSVAFQPKLLFINLFNPIYFYITFARDVIIYSQWPPIWLIAGTLFYTLLSLIIGFLVFNKLKKNFAEMV